MASELLVILLVALIVFGPNKLPMLASHFAKALRQINGLKREASQFWNKIVAEQQLLENEKKAEEADKDYGKKEA